MMELAAAGAALLATQAVESRSLGGGLSRIARVGLADGRSVVVKDGPAPRVEAAMLRAIARSGCPTPAVLAVDSSVLVIEDLEADPPAAPPSLGAAVAAMHAATGERYGWESDYAFASVAIPNAASDDWPGFFAERRLLGASDALPADIARRLDTLAADLANRLPARPTAALLHGDLWGGNIVSGRAGLLGLVDPAAYYGHCEVDLAMMALFGGGPSESFLADYGPLEPGAGERRAIYQLWPAIVHLRLFGASYRGMVESRLATAGV